MIGAFPPIDASILNGWKRRRRAWMYRRRPKDRRALNEPGGFTRRRTARRVRTGTWRLL